MPRLPKAKRLFKWLRNTLAWIHQSRQGPSLERCLIHHLTQALKMEMYSQPFFFMSREYHVLGHISLQMPEAQRQMSRRLLRAEHLYKDIFSFSFPVIYPAYMTHNLLKSTVITLPLLHHTGSFMSYATSNSNCMLRRLCSEPALNPDFMS